MRQEKQKLHLIAEYADRYGLKKTDTSTGSSIAKRCSFWETRGSGVLITDYNRGEDLEEKEVLMLINTLNRVSMVISFEAFKKEDIYNECLTKIAS